MVGAACLCSTWWQLGQPEGQGLETSERLLTDVPGPWAGRIQAAATQSLQQDGVREMDFSMSVQDP